MTVAALTSWSAALLAGLVLMMIWLFTYDRSRRSLVPVVAVSAHILLGMAGVILWLAYLLYGQPLGWIALAVLTGTISLGLAMAGRWLRFRATVVRDDNFPLPLVTAHGALAVCTLVLVVLALA